MPISHTLKNSEQYNMGVDDSYTFTLPPGRSADLEPTGFRNLTDQFLAVTLNSASGEFIWDSSSQTQITTVDVIVPRGRAWLLVYRETKGWIPYIETMAAAGFMGGTANSMTIDTTTRVITGYESDFGVGKISVDPVNGEFTFGNTGFYRVTALVIGTQGNDIKEEQMFLNLRLSNAGADNGDYIIASFDVATDKTYYRTFSASFLRLYDSGETVALSMDATAGLGTFTFERTSFEVVAGA